MRTANLNRSAATAAAAAVAAAVLGAASAGWAQARPPAGASPVLPPRETRAASLEAARIGIARLKYGGGGDWYSDPSSLPNLLAEFERRTGILTAARDRAMEPLHPELFAYPFLYMTGHGNIALTDPEIERLREHLLGGGFLWADDNYGMDRSFRRLVERLFPDRRLEPVPFDHPIYHCFYHLEGPPKIHEHDGKPPEGLGIFEAERLVLFYTYECDIGDGLEDPEVHDSPPELRELAAQMAVNVLYYALTH